MIPIINKPTRVTKKTATSIDHIITNCFADTNFKTEILKRDISDHFPICVFLSPMIDENKNEVAYISISIYIYISIYLYLSIYLSIYLYIYIYIYI